MSLLRARDDECLSPARLLECQGQPAPVYAPPRRTTQFPTVSERERERARARVAFYDEPPRRFKSAHFNDTRAWYSPMEGGTMQRLYIDTEAASLLRLRHRPFPFAFFLFLPLPRTKRTSSRTHEKRSLARRVHQSLREAGDDSVPAAVAPNAGERESEAPLGESESIMVGVTASAPIDARRCRVPPSSAHCRTTAAISSRLARATDGYIQNAGQTTINTFSQAGWQTR